LLLMIKIAEIFQEELEVEVLRPIEEG
jgi:hypothetical protein